MLFLLQLPSYRNSAKTCVFPQAWGFARTTLVYLLLWEGVTVETGPEAGPDAPEAGPEAGKFPNSKLVPISNTTSNSTDYQYTANQR